MRILCQVNRYTFKYRRKTVAFGSCCPNNSYSTSKTGNWNILFFGTDHFSLPSLEILNKQRLSSSLIQRLDVVTSFKYRKNPVKKYADLNGLACRDWPLNTEISDYDLGVVVSFGHLIPESVISMFPMGMLNVHASLLPRWRGAAPIIYAIMNGDPVTGVSVMRIRPKAFDIGEIIDRKEVEIGPSIMMPELHNMLSSEGAKLLLECIHDLPTKLMNAKPQSNQGVTYAPKVTNSLGEITWNNSTASQVYNLFRALYSFKPLTTKWNGLIIKLTEIVVDNHSTIDLSKPPGYVEFVKKDKHLRIYCIDGRSVVVKKLAVEGKNAISAIDFNNGFLKKNPDCCIFT